MDFQNVNLFAIIIAAISSIVLGMFWYSNYLFGGIWQKLIKKENIELNSNASMAYVFTTIASIIMAYALEIFIINLNINNIISGIQVGFWVWLGFVATTSLIDYLFSGRDVRIYLIFNGYQLISFILMSAILALL